MLCTAGSVDPVMKRTVPDRDQRPEADSRLHTGSRTCKVKVSLDAAWQQGGRPHQLINLLVTNLEDMPIPVPWELTAIVPDYVALDSVCMGPGTACGCTPLCMRWAGMTDPSGRHCIRIQNDHWAACS